MAVASRPFPLTAREKFVPAIENRPSGLEICFLPESYKSSARPPVSGIFCVWQRNRSGIQAERRPTPFLGREPVERPVDGLRRFRNRTPARAVFMTTHVNLYLLGPSRRPSRVRVCPGVCDADIAIIRSHRHARHVSRTKRYDRKLRSRTAPRANFCPGSILLSPGCRRRVSAPPPRCRGSWAPRGDHPVAAKCSDRPSTPGAAGTSADRGFRAGRRDGGVAARYRGGSAGPSAQIFARDI